MPARTDDGCRNQLTTPTTRSVPVDDPLAGAVTTAVDQVGIVGSNRRQRHAARNWIGSVAGAALHNMQRRVIGQGTRLPRSG